MQYQGTTEEVQSDSTEKNVQISSERIVISPDTAPLEEEKKMSQNDASAPNRTIFPKERLDLRRLRAHASSNGSNVV